MTLALVVVHTYGSHRVLDPRTKQAISAYKIGYSGATSRVLLVLFNDNARDVSSKRRSYHYIHIDKAVQVKHGFILLRLTNAELQTAANITRGLIRRCFVGVMDNGGHFRTIASRIITCPLADLNSAANTGILVERGQCDP